MTITSTLLDSVKPNPDWARLPIFDRKDWKRVRFGDVVENRNETVSDPVSAGIERFIGLEHLEPGSLHIRSWGNTADGTTFTRRCRPGQVLFGKRRTYQRKVAVAEFDAVVSGDIYVLVPKNNRLRLELLPFICLSERFFQHAVGTSAGSLSPRTNWSSLAGFEFDLPPLEQQRRIGEMLWAVDEVNNKEKIVVKSLKNSLEITLSSILKFGLNRDSLKKTEIGPLPSSWSLGYIRDLVKKKDHALLAGPFGTIFKAKDFRNEGVRIIQVRHVAEEGFIWGDNETFMDQEVYARIHKP